ncbi:uncharacterized protein LOC143040582 isoform X1 [Oratosquilla oratoria]|uniref:uncharacterized protein LOC143040582 isoform X1 n=1 Tax=Oratosquilla oratoria TaxID=337810 RepID=UPI003F77745A
MCWNSWDNVAQLSANTHRSNITEQKMHADNEDTSCEAREPKESRTTKEFVLAPRILSGSVPAPCFFKSASPPLLSSSNRAPPSPPNMNHLLLNDNPHSAPPSHLHTNEPSFPPLFSSSGPMRLQGPFQQLTASYSTTSCTKVTPIPPMYLAPKNKVDSGPIEIPSPPTALDDLSKNVQSQGFSLNSVPSQGDFSKLPPSEGHPCKVNDAQYDSSKTNTFQSQDTNIILPLIPYMAFSSSPPSLPSTHTFTSPPLEVYSSSPPPPAYISSPSPSQPQSPTLPKQLKSSPLSTQTSTLFSVPSTPLPPPPSLQVSSSQPPKTSIISSAHPLFYPQHSVSLAKERPEILSPLPQDPLMIESTFFTKSSPHQETNIFSNNTSASSYDDRCPTSKNVLGLSVFSKEPVSTSSSPSSSSQSPLQPHPHLSVLPAQLPLFTDKPQQPLSLITADEKFHQTLDATTWPSPSSSSATLALQVPIANVSTSNISDPKTSTATSDLSLYAANSFPIATTAATVTIANIVTSVLDRTISSSSSFDIVHTCSQTQPSHEVYSAQYPQRQAHQKQHRYSQQLQTSQYSYPQLQQLQLPKQEQVRPPQKQLHLPQHQHTQQLDLQPANQKQAQLLQQQLQTSQPPYPKQQYIPVKPYELLKSPHQVLQSQPSKQQQLQTRRQQQPINNLPYHLLPQALQPQSPYTSSTSSTLNKKSIEVEPSLDDCNLQLSYRDQSHTSSPLNKMGVTQYSHSAEKHFHSDPTHHLEGLQDGHGKSSPFSEKKIIRRLNDPIAIGDLPKLTEITQIYPQPKSILPDHYKMAPIEQILQQSIRDGVLMVLDKGDFHCRHCNLTLSNLDEAGHHLVGETHITKQRKIIFKQRINRLITPQNWAAQHTATPLRNPIGYRPCRPPERVLRPMIRQPHLTSRTNEPFREEHKQTSGHPVQQQYDQTDILETQIGQRERKHKDAPKMEQREELKEELEGESVVLRRHHKAFDNDSKTLERGNFPLHAYPTMQRQYALRWKRPISLHQKVEERQESGANNLLKKNQSSSTIKGSPEYDKPPLISKFLKVRASVNLVGPTDQVYRNLSNPRGLVFIFNYKKYASGRLSERRGSGHDVKNLRCLFVQMGYSVHAYEDLTGWGTLAQIREIQGRQDLWAVDSFIIILLGQGANAGTFYASDMRRIPLDDVRLEFSEGRCPALKGKPKIVLANFFHGNVEEILSAPSTSPNDMLTLHASIAGIRPRRHPLESTIFVQILSEVLSTESWATPLEELCFQVCWRVQSCGGTACLERNKDFKEFYFNP